MSSSATVVASSWLTNGLRRHWPAFAFAVAGLVVTAWVATKMARWAQARDNERFQAECRVIAGMIEQKMERYETAFTVLRDVCGRSNAEVPPMEWGNWLAHMLDVGVNYPNALLYLVGAKVVPGGEEDFARRAIAEVFGHPGKILTNRTNASVWVPTWTQSRRPEVELVPLGTDLLAGDATRPSFEPVLRATVGWVSERPFRLPSSLEGEVTGFWFALSVPPREFSNYVAWQRQGESNAAASRRRAAHRAKEAAGLLAVFIGGDDFLEQFNGKTNLVRVQLYTTREPGPETLLNPGQPPPTQPRFIRDQLMAWYGKRWTARFHSTPVFEAGSLRYRAALVWWIGVPLSLAGAGALAWQTRGRLREAALAEQLRQALSRQERLSRDLHDGTLQSVYGVGLGLQRARRLLERHPADAGPQLADTTLALQRVIGELRAFIRETDPAAREDVALGEALAGVVGHLDYAADMKLHLEVSPGADQGLTPAQSLQLLNIVREALSNAVRHSGAGQVRVSLGQADGVVRLEVSDDGCGFDVPAAEREGRGLRNLAARVGELGGTHRWESAADRGSRLVVEVPL